MSSSRNLSPPREPGRDGDIGRGVGRLIRRVAHRREDLIENTERYGLRGVDPDVADELSTALQSIRTSGARSVQLSIRLDESGLPHLSEAARGLGFFFCGLAPAFADGADLLQLQWLSEPLDTGKLQLFTDQAKKLVAFIDRERGATVAAT